MSDTPRPAATDTPETAPSAPRPDADLSRQIEATVERDPHDLVKCTRVYGPYYRCNWWSLDTVTGTRRDPVAPWAALASQRIRKSRFLSASLSSAGKLKIKEVAPVPATA